MGGKIGFRKLYDTMSREYCWTFMSEEEITTVRDCTRCAKTRGTSIEHQKHLKLVSPVGPLEFVAMDLLGPLPTTKRDQKNMLFIKDMYNKITRVVAMEKLQAPQRTEASSDSWNMP